MSVVRPKIGLALGGGAARGLAHLGVIDALERAGLAPAAVAGTSMGAIIGGLWCVETDADAVRRRLVGFFTSDVFRRIQLEFLSRQPPTVGGLRSRVSRAVRRGWFLGRTYLRESFVPEPIYRGHLLRLLPASTIEALPVPFAAMASDLVSGRSVVFRSGGLREAAMASGAIPGVMPPLVRDELVLVDGVASDRVPCRALLAMDVDLIIAVDVSFDFETYIPPLHRGVAIHNRAQQVTEWSLRATRTAMAEILLRPEVASFNPLDFAGALPCIDKGREAMEQKLPRLRRVLRGHWARRLAGRTLVQRARRREEEGHYGPPPLVL
jgi:NTE family protein